MGIATWDSAGSEAIAQLPLWDTLIIAGVTVPGRAKVTGKVCRKRDQKSPPGADGGRLTDLGFKPTEITITVELWTDPQFQAFQSLLATIKPKPNKSVALTGTSADFPNQGIGMGLGGLSLPGPAPAAPPAPPVKGPKPFAMSHPALAVMGIKSLYILEISLPAPTSTPGVFEVSMKCVEFLTPGKGNVTSTATASVDTSTNALQTAIPLPSSTDAGP